MLGWFTCVLIIALNLPISVGWRLVLLRSPQRPYSNICPLSKFCVLSSASLKSHLPLLRHVSKHHPLNIYFQYIFATAKRKLSRGTHWCNLWKCKWLRSCYSYFLSIHRLFSFYPFVLLYTITGLPAGPTVCLWLSSEKFNSSHQLVWLICQLVLDR